MSHRKLEVSTVSQLQIAMSKPPNMTMIQAFQQLYHYFSQFRGFELTSLTVVQVILKDTVTFFHKNKGGGIAGDVLQSRIGILGWHDYFVVSTCKLLRSQAAPFWCPYSG
jgi:hypothetical protein